MATPLPSTASLTTRPSNHGIMRTQIGLLRDCLAGVLGEDGETFTALQTLGALGSSYMAKSATYAATAADAGTLIDVTGTWTLTLPAMSALFPGWAVIARNAGAGTVTLAPLDSATIDGGATIAVLPGRTVIIMANGTVWLTSQSTVSEATLTRPGLLSAADKAVLAGLGPLASASTVNLATQATGVLQAAQAPALTGDVTTTAGSLATTLAPNVVGNTKLAQTATARLKGRLTAGSGNVEDLTAAEVKTLLAVTAGDVTSLMRFLDSPPGKKIT